MAGPQDYAATAAAVAAANKKAAATPTPTKTTTPTKTATATKTTVASTTGALPASFTPYITPVASTTVSPNGLFIGPIPTGTTRTATGYTPTVGSPGVSGSASQFGSETPWAQAAAAFQTANAPAGGGTTGSTVSASTARSILEMYLRDAGIPADMLKSSVDYLEAMDQAGIKDQTQLIDMYMNNKSFTTKTGTVLNSPFYAKYTSLGEGVINPNTDKPYSAKELFAWRLGMEDKVNQYGFSPLFVTEDNLKKYIKNNVSVDKFEERMQQANLAEAEADPNKIAALRKMGYLSATGGLKDFYLNADIGQKQLEENQRVGAFATENLRFAGKGIGFDAARIKQISAIYGNQTEAQATQSANALYAGVAQNLQQTVALSGIYDRTGLTAAQETPGIQTGLENEILYATPDELRKRVAESNQRAFEAKSGVGQGSLNTKPTLGLI